MRLVPLAETVVDCDLENIMTDQNMGKLRPVQMHFIFSDSQVCVSLSCSPFALLLKIAILPIQACTKDWRGSTYYTYQKTGDFFYEAGKANEWRI